VPQDCPSHFLDLITLTLLHQRIYQTYSCLEPNPGVPTLIYVAWAEFSHVDTNVPLLWLLQDICGEEDFPKTSAKQRGGARSGCRTLLWQVCLVEEAGSRDIDRSEQHPGLTVTRLCPCGALDGQCRQTFVY